MLYGKLAIVLAMWVFRVQGNVGEVFVACRHIFKHNTQIDFGVSILRVSGNPALQKKNAPAQAK